MTWTGRPLVLQVLVAVALLVIPANTATSLRVFSPALAVEESSEDSLIETAHVQHIEHAKQDKHHIGHWSMVNVKDDVRGELHRWLGPLRVTAVALTIVLQVSPARSIYEMHLHKDVLRYDGYPYFTVLAGAAQWTLYGAAAAWATKDTSYFTMIESNGPGVILGLFYVYIYHKYVAVGDNRCGAMRRYLTAGFAVLVVELVSLFTWRHKAVFWLGFVGAIGSCQIGFGPFMTLHEVIKTRSTACWPTDLISICFVQSAVTATFGFCISDPWIYVPNVFGVFAAAVQLGFVAWAAEGRPAAKGKGCSLRDTAKEHREEFIHNKLGHTSPRDVTRLTI